MANVINMGGGGANVQSKTVKSTTAKQTLTPPSGVDGFSPVIVSPMVLQEKTVTLSTSQQVLKPPSGVDGFSKVTVPAATYGGGLYYDTSVAANTKVISASATTLCCGSVATAQSDIPSSGTYIAFAMCENIGASNQQVTALLLVNGALQYANLSSSVTVSMVNGTRQVVFPYAFFNAAYHAEAYF